MTLQDHALRYAALDYPVFPCVPGGKAPLTSHGFHDATTDPAQIAAWWSENPDANIGLPTAGLLVVDIDGADNPWPEDPVLAEDLARGPASHTPRGGRHHFFRQPADRTWKNSAGRIAPKVDTRANGGYVVVPPSMVDGTPYRWADGRELDAGPDGLPDPSGRLAALLDSLGGDGATPAGAPAGAHTASQGVDLVGGGNPIPSGQRDDTLTRLAGAMRRHGMGRDEILAAITQTNRTRCQPPLPQRQVEKIARSIARREPDQVTVAVAENHWGQDADAVSTSEDSTPAARDPGPMPDELFRIPGFVSEVMDHCLETAPYPNVVMSFAGALALQATLAGRKVRDPGGNRTNIYLLGLAHSASGKEQPRTLNTEILHAVGLAGQLGGRFASGEGLQDALFAEPCMLFQTDEIDGMLQSINKSKDARHENIMGTMLTVYSAAGSRFPMRRKAGKELPGTIDQPCLVVFGTAIPNHYYEALSERMLTNGFFARTITLECGKRSPGQDPRVEPPPARVLETATWWAGFRPGAGNLEHFHPTPREVQPTAEAKAILTETRLEAEAEYEAAEKSGDAVGTTVWGRTNEHARKLALLYAISENHLQPEIDRAAAAWARRFVMHQAKRMLFMAQAHVADTPFHADCLKFLQKLRQVPGRELAHSVLLKRTKADAKSFQALVTTLEQRGDIVTRTQSTSGRSGRFYRLADETGEGSREG